MTEPGEQFFLDQVRQSLDRGCDALDGHTRSRLTAIRHEALARRARPHWMRWFPVTGLATACSLVIAISLTTGNPVTTDDPVSDDALENLDLLTAEEGLEFYENYEFYQWLAENGASA